MAKEINGALCLNAEEWRALMHNLLHPDEEVTRRRNAFLAELDSLEIEYKDGCVIINCPDLNDELILSKLDT